MEIWGVILCFDVWMCSRVAELFENLVLSKFYEVTDNMLFTRSDQRNFLILLLVTLHSGKTWTQNYSHVFHLLIWCFFSQIWRLHFYYLLLQIPLLTVLDYLTILMMKSNQRSSVTQGYMKLQRLVEREKIFLIKKSLFINQLTLSAKQFSLDSFKVKDL